MKKFEFQYQVFSSTDELNETQKMLLQVADEQLKNAYAPYSNFKVSCAILLSNNEIVKGNNVENASYPVGICAERTVLSYAISNFPDETIELMAITYEGKNNENNSPIFPCGMCRQFIIECQEKTGKQIPILLSGKTGELILIENAAHLLPFYFEGKNL